MKKSKSLITKNSEKQFNEKMLEIDRFMSEQNRMGDLKRARSISTGTAFGGVTEISMRGNDGNSIWCVLQPVEVIELIHQLAANVGCHIHVQPRKDFSSWRDWKYTEEEKAWYRGEQYYPGVGHPPQVNDISAANNQGRCLPPPEQQPGLNFERKDHEPVATKKTVNRRSTKRAAAST